MFKITILDSSRIPDFNFEFIFQNLNFEMSANVMLVCMVFLCFSAVEAVKWKSCSSG